jgi:hypothetical protein
MGGTTSATGSALSDKTCTSTVQGGDFREHDRHGVFAPPPGGWPPRKAADRLEGLHVVVVVG